MALVAVDLIPERSGQLLRQALQERLQTDRARSQTQFDLSVVFSVAPEAVAIQPDSSSTRTRIIGTATWKLTAQDTARTTLLGGTARSVDGFNIFNQQYFAADLESETVQRRVAAAVADQIVLRLAAYFTRHASRD